MTRPIGISIGITDLDVGGAEKAMIELATRLDPSRWDVDVVSLLPRGPLADRLVQQAIPYESLGVRRAMDAPRALLRWHKILKRRRPRIVHTFLYHANMLGRLAARMAGVPHCVSGIRVAERRFRSRLVFDRLTRRLVDRYVCVSPSVATFMRHAAAISSDRLVVIPNGVNVRTADLARPVDRKKDLDLSPERIILVCLGRLDRQKGVDLLLDALQILRTRQPGESSLAVLLVGDGPERGQLEESSRHHDLEGLVRFVGWQPNPQDWLASADGLVLPSRWEGMPNAVLEAMAAKLPVIATMVEGAIELVSPGRTGWLVPTESPAALADSIIQFLADPIRRRQFGLAGRECVEREFSIESMVQQYERLYESLTA